MRKELLLLAVAVVTLGIAPPGCGGKKKAAPGTQTSSAVPAETSAAVKNVAGMFSAMLRGGEVVPPVTVNDSGTATFQASPDSTQITYSVSVMNVPDINEIHLHFEAKGQNGPVVVWLYPLAPPPKTIAGVSNGIVASGIFDSSKLAGPMAGKSIRNLMAAMQGDSVSVQVHTVRNPKGELRGQVMPGAGK